MIRNAAVAAFLAAVVAACVPAERAEEPSRLVLKEATFVTLPGWTEDDHAAALTALGRSCTLRLRDAEERDLGLAGRSGDWRGVCEAAPGIAPGGARAFFEARFRPFAVSNRGVEEGLFTGYFEPEITGRRTPGGTPLYRRPPDLVTVDLGRFKPEWRGQRLAGRLDGGALLPFATRAEIGRGALAGRGLELLWADDPADAFFLEIQGSGRVRLADGGVVRLGYDGQNGHAYVPVGRILAERGEIAREAVTMQSIRAWMASRPAEAAALRDQNPSYVFFRELPPPVDERDGPPGAEGVPLSPGRSLAVDRAFLPLGVPLWLAAEDAPVPGGVLRRLVVAQDTGGAIRGPVRGDLFWGAGADAAEAAGRMKARGRYWVLLPLEAAGRIGVGM